MKKRTGIRSYLRLSDDDLAVALRAHLALDAPRAAAAFDDAAVLIGLAEVGLELAEDDAVLDFVAGGDVLEVVHVAVVVKLQKKRRASAINGIKKYFLMIYFMQGISYKMLHRLNLHKCHIKPNKLKTHSRNSRADILLPSATRARKRDCSCVCWDLGGRKRGRREGTLQKLPRAITMSRWQKCPLLSPISLQGTKSRVDVTIFTAFP